MSMPLASVVEGGQADTVALLAKLIQHPTENPPGEVGEAVEWLAGYLADRGHAVERHPVPQAFARNYRRSEVENLIVRRTFGPGPTIALSASLDTLPAGSSWNRDPFGAEIRDGVMHGRGARDSKSDIAAYVATAEALAAAGQDRGTLELHITADEESGGFLGPAFLLGQGLTAPDAVIAAGTSHQVIVGQQGVLHLEVVLRGRQAHASRPRDGRDALAAALPILAALEAERARLAMPLTVTTLTAGRGVNVVADRARFTVDRRIDAEEDGEAIEAALCALIEGAHRGDEVELECRRILLAEPVTPTGPSQTLAATLSRHAAAAFAAQVPVVSAPVASGARHYAGAGIPTALYGVGPPIIGEGIDSAGDEWVALADLEKATLALSSALAELLKG
ncbi:MAG: hypothetical protein AcusKO_27760 [Acuticoccus sp.]